MPREFVSAPTKANPKILIGLYSNKSLAYKVEVLSGGGVRWAIYCKTGFSPRWGVAKTKDRALNCIRTELEIRGYGVRSR